MMYKGGSGISSKGEKKRKRKREGERGRNRKCEREVRVKHKIKKLTFNTCTIYCILTTYV